MVRWPTLLVHTHFPSSPSCQLCVSSPLCVWPLCPHHLPPHPTTPFDLRPVTDCGAQKHIFLAPRKEGHALRHKLLSRAPLWIRPRLGLHTKSLPRSAPAVSLSSHSSTGVSQGPFLNISLVPGSLTQSLLLGEPNLREQAFFVT